MALRLPETVRNRLLRRADWRFLLPDPQPERAARRADGLLARSVEAIAGQVVDLDQAENRACDLVVVTDPGRAELSAAWRALKPAGSLYMEHNSLWPGRPDRIERQLEEAGFSEISAYWPFPNRSSTLFWLPLDSPGALHYFFENRPPPASRWNELSRPVFISAWKAAHRTGVLRPVCITARKPVSAPASQTTHTFDLSEVVRSGWQRWKLGPRPERIAWLLYTSGLRSINKTVRLVFADAQSAPRLAIKQARVPETIPALAKEAHNLRALRDRFGNKVQGVPRLLFSEGKADLFAIGETVLTGQHIYTHLNRENYRVFALSATDWLVDLAGNSPPCPKDDWWGRLVEPALDEFERNYGRALPAGFIPRLREKLSMLGDLPAVFEHRDFSPYNILVDQNERLLVLDWDSAEPDGLPGTDLAYFLSYLAFFLDGAMESRRFLDSYRKAQDPASFTGSVRLECEQRYFHRLGLDPDIAAPLRSFAWLVHSPREYEQIRADTGELPDPAALRECLYIQLLGEELNG